MLSLGSPTVEQRGQSQARWGISKIREEKEKEGDKGEGTEGQRKGKRQRRSSRWLVDMEDGESVS